MTDKSQTPASEQALDKLLHDAFPADINLSAEFENSVMDSVNALEQTKIRHRKTTRFMAVYWGVSTAIASGLLANSTLPDQQFALSSTVVILVTIASSLGAAWFVSRKSGISILNLFARTLL